MPRVRLRRTKGEPPQDQPGVSLRVQACGEPELRFPRGIDGCKTPLTAQGKRAAEAAMGDDPKRAVVVGEDAHGQRVKLAHTILLLIREQGTGQDLLAPELEIEPRIQTTK